MIKKKGRGGNKMERKKGRKGTDEMRETDGGEEKKRSWQMEVLRGEHRSQEGNWC